MIPFSEMREEFFKIAVSAEAARKSLDRLEQLDTQAPTPEQVGRYGALGAATGVGLGMLGNKFRGKGLIDPVVDTAGKAIRYGRLRAVGSDALKGAVATGAVPLLRNQLDRKAEESNLRRFLAEKPDKAAPDSISTIPVE